MFFGQTKRSAPTFMLTTLAIRNPHGVTLPRYVRPFAASVVETFGFDNAN